MALAIRENGEVCRGKCIYENTGGTFFSSPRHLFMVLFFYGDLVVTSKKI
jgi:hypothetical protein